MFKSPLIRSQGSYRACKLTCPSLVNSALYRWLMAEAKPTGWVLPVLYQVCRDLKRLSMSVSGICHIVRPSEGAE